MTTNTHRAGTPLLALLSALAWPLAATAEAPSFNTAGELERPADFREWVFLTSGLDMFYGPAAQAPNADGTRPSVFTNVYVTPPAYREFMRSGTWPDKTMFILEVRRAETAASIDNVGQVAGRAARDRVGSERRRTVRRQAGKERLGLLQLRRRRGLTSSAAGAADVGRMLLVPRREHGRRQHVRPVLPHAVTRSRSGSAPSNPRSIPRTSSNAADFARSLLLRLSSHTCRFEPSYERATPFGSRDARRARRRLRRHRHEPAVRAEGSDGGRGRRRRSRHGARRAVVDLLEPLHRHHAEVRRADPARGQRGRRRHPLAARTRAAKTRHDERLGDAPRGSRGARHRAVLLRRHDHARDLGAFAPSRASSC